MNLQDTISQMEFRKPIKTLKPQTKSKYQVAKRVFDLAAAGGFPYKYTTYQKWADKWLGSDQFKLVEIDVAAAAALNINAAASPHSPKNPNRVEHYLHCSVESLDPIVVDVNKRKVGRSYLGYTPPVVVLDGKHRKRAQLQAGRTRVLAWVGCKALKKMPEATIHEVDECACHSKPKIQASKVVLPPVEHTKIAAAYDIYASTVGSVPAPVALQDTGEGGSRPKDTMHSKGKYTKEQIKKAFKDAHKHNGVDGMGGPGLSNQGGASDKEMKAEKVKACGCNINNPLIKKAGGSGARSSGSLIDDSSASDNKVPRDASDAGPRVDPSDQLKHSRIAKVYAPGTKPGDTDQFGLNEAAAYNNNIGPRTKNTGAATSDFSRSLTAGKKVSKIWNKKLQKMKARIGE